MLTDAQILHIISALIPQTIPDIAHFIVHSFFILIALVCIPIISVHIIQYEQPDTPKEWRHTLFLCSGLSVIFGGMAVYVGIGYLVYALVYSPLSDPLCYLLYVIYALGIYFPFNNTTKQLLNAKRQKRYHKHKHCTPN